MAILQFINKCLSHNKISHIIKMQRPKFSTRPKEDLICIKSQKINYLTVGNGPKKVLCFPGALGTIWSDFKPQVEGLDSQKFTVLVWDPPGHGLSRPPERILTSKFYEEDADTAHNLIEALNFKPFSLLGWSDGGISGMIYAAKYPETLQKLVIWGSNSFLHSKDIEGYETIRNIKSWSKKASAPLIELYGEKTLQEIQNNWCDVMIEIKNGGGDICDSLLSKIKCPTLILHGDKDSLVGIDHFENLLKKIKGAKSHRFPDGKHNIHLKYANEFNEIVSKFLLEEKD